MTATQVAILAVYAAIVAVWPIRWLALTIILGRQKFLDRRSKGYSGPDFPLVSAILPAKDEESHLAGCLTSICGQTYPNLEVLVVDDRSTDQTNAIARQFAAHDSRVQVLKIDHLPGGWTGKTHAIQVATQTAQGKWLWFIDADTLHAPESLTVMMEFAREHGASMASLLPELRCETFWERVVQPLAGITLMQSFPFSAVHDVKSPLAFANGQYILVERTAYDAAGGHSVVRDRFVEDIALAGTIKRLGRPIRVALVRGLVSCRMYSSLSQLLRGWSRIYYDAFDRSPGRVALKLLDPLIFCQTGHLVLALSLIFFVFGSRDPFVVALLGLSVLHHLWMYVVFRQIHRASVPGSRAAIWYALGNLIVDMALARALTMCFTGRVSWRGTEYGNSATVSVENSSAVRQP
jgi:glycosyltransferase involved in cell wall biosynthesis